VVEWCLIAATIVFYDVFGCLPSCGVGGAMDRYLEAQINSPPCRRIFVRRRRSVPSAFMTYTESLQWKSERDPWQSFSASNSSANCVPLGDQAIPDTELWLVEFLGAEGRFSLRGGRGGSNIHRL